ncbi:MAG TPA: argininosuccinate synthase [Candidatus Latescibacteria bacterium]|nr:argininosuccinate synthase [Candidatus Latescibacterota bacterium]
MREKVVLAYSGGLDTSVSIRWIQENYGMDVITLTVDLGQGKDLDGIRDKALSAGACKAVVIDAREIFVKYFVFPALQAGAIYEGEYPLATALGRPLIAKLLVDVAEHEGAVAVAHGCTGKGNDQVRFDVSIHMLAPGLRIIAPAREWKMSRAEEIEYARKRDIPVPSTEGSPYSIDQNLWGRSIEAGVLEDPWVEPPEEVYEWTVSADRAPDQPQYVEISFEKGIPVALDSTPITGVDLTLKINSIAGQHGIGRIDHLENRLVGIKSREIYEAPAATVLHRAHQALEDLTLSKDTARFKSIVSREYSDLIYNGLWFSALHRDLRAFVLSSQQYVTGTIRMKLFKGVCSVVGRRSPYSLYSLPLATYGQDDQFDHDAAPGFIKIHALPHLTQAKTQSFQQKPMPEASPSIIPPKIGKESIKTAK